MSLVTVQVFEHDLVRVGDALRTADGGADVFTAAHHEALGAFCETTQDRYLTCGRRTARFTSYVGLLQLSDLSIEILPKADRHSTGGHGRWHRALVRMLRVVGDLGLEPIDEASLQLNPGRLFELFLVRFLDECDRLLHEGLVKGYRTQEDNLTAFRGRLLIAEQIRANTTNAARFYVAHSVYDHRQIPNLALHEALLMLEQLPVPSSLRSRACALRHRFPELPRWRPVREDLDRLPVSRRTHRYQSALRLARLILFDLAPDVRSGATSLLALLFDMNVLWERYVATLARRSNLPGVTVSVQDSRTFWRGEHGRRTLRPDITIRDPSSGRVLMIIDTKWKVPLGGQPTDADLKQMFCYHELFDCPQSMLLYPSTTATSWRTDRGRYFDRSHRAASGFLAIDGDPSRDLRDMIDAATRSVATGRVGSAERRATTRTR